MISIINNFEESIRLTGKNWKYIWNQYPKNRIAKYVSDKSKIPSELTEPFVDGVLSMYVNEPEFRKFPIPIENYLKIFPEKIKKYPIILDRFIKDYRNYSWNKIMVLIKFFPYLFDAEKKKVFDSIGEDIIQLKIGKN